LNPIFLASDFWRVAEEYRGQISSIRFVFAAPNLWGERDNFSKELKEAQQKRGAKEVSTSLRSPSGLTLEKSDPQLKEMVNYVSDGGGQMRASSARKTVFNSKNKQKAVEIDVVDSSDIGRRHLWSAIGKLFGEA
jgi:hypothetical protein